MISENILARKVVALAIASGSLKRGRCEVCKCEKNIEAHHEDYSQPLKVNWLCRRHHQELHSHRYSEEMRKYRERLESSNRSMITGKVSHWGRVNRRTHILTAKMPDDFELGEVFRVKILTVPNCRPENGCKKPRNRHAAR